MTIAPWLNAERVRGWEMREVRKEVELSVIHYRITTHQQTRQDRKTREYNHQTREVEIGNERIKVTSHIVTLLAARVPVARYLFGQRDGPGMLHERYCSGGSEIYTYKARR